MRKIYILKDDFGNGYSGYYTSLERAKIAFNDYIANVFEDDPEDWEENWIELVKTGITSDNIILTVVKVDEPMKEDEY